MSKYKMLINPIYLWKLQYPTDKINYSNLSNELGLTRQTISKLAKEAEEMPQLPIVNYHNELNNKYERAIAIYKDLVPKSHYVSQEIADALGVSRATISKYFVSDEAYTDRASQFGYVVYYFKHVDKLIYIGSTEDFVARKLQHKSSVINCSNGIGEYCKLNNINWEDLEVDILFKCQDRNEMKVIENTLISKLKPVANILK